MDDWNKTGSCVVSSSTIDIIKKKLDNFMESEVMWRKVYRSCLVEAHRHTVCLKCSDYISIYRKDEKECGNERGNIKRLPRKE